MTLKRKDLRLSTRAHIKHYKHDDLHTILNWEGGGLLTSGAGGHASLAKSMKLRTKRNLASKNKIKRPPDAHT